MALTSLFSQRFRKIPLRIVLIVPFVLQLGVAGGLIWYLSFYNGQWAVNDIAASLRNEITSRIAQNLDASLSSAVRMNQTIRISVERGLLDVRRPESLSSYLWNHLRESRNVTNIALGNEQGEYVGADLRDTGRTALQLADPSTSFNLHTYDSGPRGERRELLNAAGQYDPRKRPWYTASAGTGKPAWSAVYKHFADPALQIAASQPLYDRDGVLTGVCTSAVRLSKIGALLKSMKIGTSGQSFIIERSGLLVATSTGEQPFRSVAGRQERFSAAESSHPLTRDTSRHLASRFANLNAITSMQQLDFYVDGQRHFLQVSPYRDELGLNWLIGVVIPERDFMEHIDDNNRSTALLILVFLGVATLIGVLTARWVIRPLERLNSAAGLLAGGELNLVADDGRADELGELTRSFNSMAQRLHELLERLEQRNRELSSEVAERAQAEERLKVKNAELERFTYTVSHDLKSPLVTIKGFAGAIRKAMAKGSFERVDADLQRISAAADRMNILLNDLLELSRIGRVINAPEPVDMNLLLQDVAAHLAGPLENSGVRLIVQPGLPMVLGDRLRIAEVVQNLLENAIKYIGHPTGPLITFGLREDPDGRVFFVQDNGPGIDEKYHKVIFGLFNKLDSASEGSGIGLALVKRIIEVHGGRIWVESSGDGTGSTFCFTLSQAP
ncbi:MAG: sensor histidine kinase [Desulfuromonadales bacterium]